MYVAPYQRQSTVEASKSDLAAPQMNFWELAREGAILSGLFCPKTEKGKYRLNCIPSQDLLFALVAKITIKKKKQGSHRPKNYSTDLLSSMTRIKIGMCAVCFRSGKRYFLLWYVFIFMFPTMARKLSRIPPNMAILVILGHACQLASPHLRTG